ncbi:MAG: hypothetical protein IT436_02195 [Phycisphaerales bacterium]|nr:hypothetical protein [Phycisphaerales bacterium]
MKSRTGRALMLLVVAGASGWPAGHAAAQGGVWKLGSDVFDASATSFATNCIGTAGPFTVSASGMVAGFFGNDYGQQAFSHSAVFPECTTAGTGFGYVVLNGVGTSVVTIEMECKGHTFHECCAFCAYAADGVADLTADLGLLIDGVPAGAVQTVYYTWSAFSFHIREHEAGAEDPANIRGALLLNGVDVTGGVLNVAEGTTPPNISLLQALRDQTGSFDVPAPGPVSVGTNCHADSHVMDPGEPLNCFSGPGWRDNGTASYFIRITLSLDAPPPPPLPPPPTGPGMEVEFSLDIGSDAELSDPAATGNEVFDPGDMYVWLGPPLPPGGLNGVRDDATVVAPGQHHPDPAPGTLPAPACSGAPGVGFFDLDGSDSLDTDLTLIIPRGALADPIPYFASQTIFGDDFLFLSFDDDGPGNYGVCDIPTSTPATSVHWYGRTGVRDEVMGVDTVTAMAPRLVRYAYPFLSEAELHISLAPNPDLLDPEDDDCDALDIVQAAGQNPFWYFSADHEAAGGMNPGHIYMAAPATPSGRVVAVNGVTHLGLRDGTDLRDFEFVWKKDPGRPGTQLYLAVLFAVAPDDPATPLDESGGLDPRMVYASFMTGVSFPEFQMPFADPVDGIAAWWRNLDSRLPGACPIDYTGDGQVDFADYLEFLNLYNAQDPRADLNGDGLVDFLDYLQFLNYYAGPCP